MGFDCLRHSFRTRSRADYASNKFDTEFTIYIWCNQGIKQNHVCPQERPAGKEFLYRPDLKGNIRFNKVSFSYPSNNA